jgi:outer membrane receptor protein involved in Fe transport
MRTTFQLVLACLGFAAISAPSNAQVTDSALSGPSDPQTSTQLAQGPSQLSQVLVTATRRTTDLQVTPEAISVLSGIDLTQRHLVDMEDYLAELPGVSFQGRGADSNTITIRGIGLGSQLDPNSPVSSYFGEVPLTGLGNPANGNQAGNGDLRMVDIQRVEVLRGPQGTLYGSGSLGGTVRTIPNPPDLRKTEATVAANYSFTGSLDGENDMVQAVANAPLIQGKLALRMVAYRFFDDGYIHNVAVSDPTPQVTAAVDAGAFVQNKDHVGSDLTDGVRVSALWQPTDAFSATLTYANQRDHQDGMLAVQTSLPGPYLQSRTLVGDAGNSDEYIDANLTFSNVVLKYDLGWGSFLNSTSWVDDTSGSDTELSFYGAPFVGESAPNRLDTHLFTDEVRFTSKFNGPLQLLAGLYYEKENTFNNLMILWSGYPPPPADDYFESINSRDIEKQRAAFGELSFTPFASLTLTAGARVFRFESATPLYTSLGAPQPQQGTGAGTSNWTGKLDAAYKINKQLFVYALWSQGFRKPILQSLPPGISNPDGTVSFVDGIDRVVPTGLLKPDSVDNYEMGLKFRSTDNRLRASLTGFVINWHGIPIVPSLTKILGYGLYFNAGEAKSKGVEFETAAILPDDLILQLSGSWVDSVLAKSAPGLGNDGARLPGSAPYNAHAGLEKRFMVGGRDAFARADYTYVGRYYSQFQQTGSPSGDYSLIDLTSGITVNNVDYGFFVKNLLNRDDFTWVDNVFGKDLAYRLHPRIVGVNFRLTIR